MNEENLLYLNKINKKINELGNILNETNKKYGSVRKLYAGANGNINYSEIKGKGILDGIYFNSNLSNEDLTVNVKADGGESKSLERGAKNNDIYIPFRIEFHSNLQVSCVSRIRGEIYNYSNMGVYLYYRLEE